MEFATISTTDKLVNENIFSQQHVLLHIEITFRCAHIQDMTLQLSEVQIM